MQSSSELINAQVKDGDHISRSFTNCKKKAGHKTKGSSNSFLQNLEEKWKTIQSRHNTLLSEKNSEIAELNYFKEDYFGEIEATFLLERGKYFEAIDAFNTATVQDAPSHSTTVHPTQPRRKLLPIPRPEVNGNYSNWPSFKDYFIALVDSDNSLRQVEKLHYLKSSLSGDAASLIKNISITEDNYTSVWQTLSNYYDNTRNIIRQCLNVLFQLKSVPSESNAALKTLRDGTHEAIEALRVLKHPVDQMDDLLVHMTVQKLDSTTRRDWKLSLGDSKEPTTWKELDTFLKTRIQALENTEGSASDAACRKSNKPPSKSFNTSKLSAHTASKGKPTACALCNKLHAINFCEQFKAYSPDNRYKFVSEKQLCFNCLKAHQVSACRSPFNCNVCQGRHHTLLHHDFKGSSLQPTRSSTISEPLSTPGERLTAVNTLTTYAAMPQSCPILLATARVCIVTHMQGKITVRALVDPCSEASFMTENLAQRLRLPRQSIFVPVLGVGAAQCYTARSAAEIDVSSRYDETNRLKVRTLIIPKLTEYLPPSRLVNSSLLSIKDLPLADPQFHLRDRIEMILGADAFTHIIQDGLHRSPDGELIAQSTSLGWILTGSISTVQGNSTPAITSLQCICDTRLSQHLEEFWRQEEASVPPHVPFTAEELECESHFLATHKRAENGKYILRLPVKANRSQLGDSYSSAHNMLLRTEHRFHRLPQLKEQYVKFMDDYLQLEHIKQAPLQPPAPTAFYLPHHGVFKAHGDTSKLRVVFNGSVKLTTGLALNDCLHAGPKLQLDIFEVLLTWRKHKIVFTADIKQMFRQILITEEDQPLRQILWRNSEEQEVQAFYLKTVTYELASSSYQEIRTLLQLATDEEHRFPRAAAILCNCRYVDDILVGADSTTEALHLKDELVELLKAGGFPLSKWSSNTPKILATIPSADLASADQKTWMQQESTDSFRTLGVSWHPREDVFAFHFKQPTETQAPTKRSVLSLTAQLYDPLGWIHRSLSHSKYFCRCFGTPDCSGMNHSCLRCKTAGIN